MSFSYWSIDMLPVDIVCKHVIKLFYIQERQFTNLTSDEVNQLFNNTIYKTSNCIVYGRYGPQSKEDNIYEYYCTQIYYSDGIKNIYFQYLCNQLLYTIDIRFEASYINRDHIKLSSCNFIDAYTGQPMKLNQAIQGKTYHTKDKITFTV